MEDNNHHCRSCGRTLTVREYASDVNGFGLCTDCFSPTMQILRERLGVRTKDWVNGVLQ